MLSGIKIGGALLHEGKQLSAEDTAQSINMTNGSKLLVLQTGMTGQIEPKMWFRTKKTSIEWDDYTNLSSSEWDALMFKAKRDVYFCGVGMIKNYENQDFVLEVKYRVIEDEYSNEEGVTIEVDNTRSPVDEQRMHWFDI